MMCTDRTILDHEEFIRHIMFVFSVEDPFGDIHTNRIIEVYEGRSISIVVLAPGNGNEKRAWFLARYHFPANSQMNSSDDLTSYR